MTSLPTDLAGRKSLGAWYTPVSIVRPLVRWAVRSPHDHVFDPAVGDGVFLAEAAGCLKQRGKGIGTQLHGIDVNPDAIVASKSILADVLGPDDLPDLRVNDFFLVEPPTRLLGDLHFVDAVVGNPPYVRYQTFAGPSRKAALIQAERAGVRLTSLSSSWAPFVVHAVSFLRSGGRMALVLPEKLVHAAYASEVRKFLRQTFRLTVVVQFSDHLFPGSQERVVLLLAEGKGEGPVGELRLGSVRHPEDIKDLGALIESSESFPPEMGPQKWEKEFDNFAARILSHLESLDFLVPLRTIGKANIGYVSGANDYFVFKPSQARGRGFPLRLLRPTIVAARQVPGAMLTTDDLRNLAERDEKCLLWTGNGTELHQVAAYMREGCTLGISSRYKCRKREPWFVVPGIVAPDALMTYMSDEFPLLILNTARATCANTLLTINLDGVNPSARVAFVAAYYNSATLLSVERIGRRYGGGVLKLEPSEADRLLVPNPIVVKQIQAARSLLSRVDRFLRAGSVSTVPTEIDNVFLRDLCGLNGTELEAIRDSRLRRRDVRKRRSASVPTHVTPHQ